MSKEVSERMLTPELLAQLQEWNKQASARQETLAEMALAWILHHQEVTSVLVGANSTAQLQKESEVLKR